MTNKDINFDPYKTTTLRSFDFERVLKQYDSNWDNNDAKYTELQSGYRTLNFVDGVKFVISEHFNVAPFAHPIPRYSDILLDIRSYSKFDKVKKVINITDYSRFQLDMVRVRLMQLSRMDIEISDILLASKLPALVYSTAINNIITSRHPLESESGQIIQILALMYYVNLFHKDDYWVNSDNALKAAGKYAKALRVNPAVMIKLTEQNIPLNSLEDLTEAIKKYSESRLLDNIDPGTILTLSKSLWHGAGAAELSAVALDDPATLMALCYSSIKDFNYRKTRIGLISNIYKNEINQFCEYIEYLIRQLVK